MSRRQHTAPTPADTVTVEPALIQETPPPLPRKSPAAAAPGAPRTGPGEDDQSTAVRPVQLEISDGTTLTMHGTVIIGRAPTHPERFAHALVLPDQTRTLSRDHLVIGITPAGQVWAADQGSANGSSIARGRSWVRLTPDQQTPITDEDIIRFADFSLRIHTAADPGGTASA